MHPTLKRFTKIAQAMGSTAQTQKGIISYIKNHYRRPKFKSRLDFGNFKLISLKYGKYIEFKSRSTRWAQEERENRRAKKDLKFRKFLVAKLKREAANLMKIPYCDAPFKDIVDWNASMPSNVDKVHSINTRLRKIAPKSTHAPFLKRWVGNTIPIPGLRTAKKTGAEINMIGNDARLLHSFGPSWRDYRPGETEWKNGRPVSYTRTVNDNYIRSFGVVSAGGSILRYIYHETIAGMTAPKGYKFGSDEQGLKIFKADSIRDDFHFDLQDLWQGPEYLSQKIEENRNQRLKMEAEIRAQQAEIDGVFVCFRDSIRAGNCQAGTMGFIDRNRLDPKKHYPALDLLKFSNDYGRLKLAIGAAAIRHKKEMERGYALLEEHCP